MEMTEADIRKAYREGKYPSAMITVLADLNATDRKTIIKILGDLVSPEVIALGERRGYDTALFQRLYDEGKSDREISHITQATTTTISGWRNSKGLKPNSKNTLTPEQMSLRQKLYEQGLCDRDIAEQLGIRVPRVTYWRHSNNLPPNPSPVRYTGRRLEMYQSGMSDREIAEAQGVSPSAITQWRRHHKLKANSKREGEKAARLSTEKE